MNEKNISTSTLSDLTYTFPKSEEIIISRSDLQIQLQKFKLAITNAITLDSIVGLLVVLMALWTPIATSEFKGVLGHNPLTIRGAYIAIALIVSAHSIYKSIILPVQFNRSVDSNSAIQEPEQMSQIILNKCMKK